MAKPQGQYNLLVTDIRNAYKQRDVRFIHLITFIDNDGTTYVAEELDTIAASKFIKGIKNKFEVIHPGKNGNLDWIKFGGGASTVTQPTKDDMIIAQTAFNNSVALGIKYNWDNETIINNAYNFAGNIKLIAKQLAEELI